MGGHVEHYRIPTSVGEAVRILAREGNRSALIAGGSVQSLRLAPRVRTLVDLMRCGLEGVRLDKKGARLGATTCAATIAATAELDAFGSGVLREAAAAISAQAVRN